VWYLCGSSSIIQAIQNSGDRKEEISMRRLRATYNGCPVYNAGIPNFRHNFSRDSLMAGLLMNNEKVLREQLRLSSEIQGRESDPLTGEEFGKIHHEYPGVKLNGRLTSYDACDTTALYLIGMEAYLSLTGDLPFIRGHRRNIERAVEYIVTHTNNGLFWEDPAFCGASRFALKVTYWKDSQLPHEKEEPKYPIVYSLVHFQNARALQSAAQLLDRPGLLSLAKTMVKAGLDTLWTGESFLVAVDRDMPIPGPSSDSLHILAYLDPEDPEIKKMAARVEMSSRSLETLCGYRSASEDLTSQMKDQYHSGASVWVFEQAIIHYGGKKFGLPRVQRVSRRVRPYLDTDPEILGFDHHGEIIKIGCDPQLWTIAAKQYFDKGISPVIL